MSFISIITAIQSVLSGITSIHEVHDFDKGKFDGYPAVVVFPSENASEFATTSQNLREYVFTIRFHQPMEKIGTNYHKDADRILRELLDEAITAFDTNFSLSGVVNWCKATPSSWGYQERDTGVVRIAEIKLSCMKLVSVV